MGVHPGGQGRPFDPDTAARVRAVKTALRRLTVSVDGGVTDVDHRARDSPQAAPTIWSLVLRSGAQKILLAHIAKLRRHARLNF